MKILQKQTLDNGEEELTSSQADFLASLSPSQVRERERMITVTSGRTCSVQYKKSDPLGLLVKTLLESSRWFSPARRLKWEAKPLFSEKITEKEYCYDKSMLSKPSVKTLSEKDIPSNRCLFRLVPSERPTEETGCGLLPTVQTQGLKMCDENGKTRFYPMELLQTPMATDIYHPERVKNLKDAGAETMASRKNGSNRPNGLMDFMDFYEMLPTPTMRDYKGAPTIESIHKRGRNPITNNLADRFAQTGKSSQLNPLFVEEMMGFPLMWTTLPFLSQNGDKNQLKDTGTP